MNFFNAVTSFFTLSAPPRPIKIVEEELSRLNMTLGDVYVIFKVFIKLKRASPTALDGRQLEPFEISTSTISALILTAKEELEGLLKTVVLMCSSTQTLHWDNFLYFCLQFCSMSRLELSQLMFFVIVKSIKSWTLHYLTSSQLGSFYGSFRDSPVDAFNTRLIEFGQLSFGRYYISDFVELSLKHTQLVNPLIYLQRNFQQQLPGLRFWDRDTRLVVSNRRVTLDFFLLQKTKLFISERDTVFNETCVSLLPESLNEETIKKSEAVRAEGISFIARSREQREREPDPFLALSTGHKAPLL